MLRDYQELNRREGRDGEVGFRRREQRVQSKEGKQNLACLKNANTWYHWSIEQERARSERQDVKWAEPGLVISVALVVNL